MGNVVSLLPEPWQNLQRISAEKLGIELRSRQIVKPHQLDEADAHGDGIQLWILIKSGNNVFRGVTTWCTEPSAWLAHLIRADGKTSAGRIHGFEVCEDGILVKVSLINTYNESPPSLLGPEHALRSMTCRLGLDNRTLCIFMNRELL